MGRKPGSGRKRLPPMKRFTTWTRDAELADLLTLQHGEGRWNCTQADMLIRLILGGLAYESGRGTLKVPSYKLRRDDPDHAWLAYHNDPDNDDNTEEGDNE